MKQLAETEDGRLRIQVAKRRVEETLVKQMEEVHGEEDPEGQAERSTPSGGVDPSGPQATDHPPDGEDVQFDMDDSEVYDGDQIVQLGNVNVCYEEWQELATEACCHTQ